jgi:hypothetical protein
VDIFEVDTVSHSPCADGQPKWKLVVPPAAVWVPGITKRPSIGPWNSLVCGIVFW